MKIKCLYLQSKIPRKREREREREGIDTSSLWYINKFPIPCKPRKEDIGLQPKGSLHYNKQEKK